MEKLSAELKIRRTTGASGGGMVEVEINGALEVLGCKIEPQLFAQGDRELLEDLLVAAMNDAVTKGKQLHAGAEGTHQRSAIAWRNGSTGEDRRNRPQKCLT